MHGSRTWRPLGLLLTLGACTAAPATTHDAPAPIVAPPAVPPLPAEPAPEPELPTARDPDPPASLQAPGFMFVYRGQVVLEPAADAGWGIGPVQVERSGDSVGGRQALDPNRLPAALAELGGAEVTLYGPTGGVCRGRLGALTLVGHHRGLEPDADVPDDMPSMPALVAALGATDRPCDGALWARRSDLPAPTVFVRSKRPAPALLARARLAAAAQPRFTALKDAHAEMLAELPPAERTRLPTWPRFVAAQMRTTVWSSPTRTLVLVDLGDPESVRCSADFSESLSLVFEARADTLVLLSADGSWRTSAVFDVEGDGVLELLAPPSNDLVALLSSDFKIVDELRFPSEEDC